MTSRVTASTRVSADCATAFRIFVDDIDLWWRRGPMYRSIDGVGLRFDQGPDGALIQELEGGREHILGRVLAWEPPTRILLRWRLTNFAPEESTEVEVRFAAAGGETRVTIEHRGLDLLRSDHPARHGRPSPQFEINRGQMWREILDAFKTRAGG